MPACGPGSRWAVPAVTPVRIEPVEDLLVGGPLDEQQIRRAAALAGELATPADDLHAPAAYRRRATVVEVARALRMAASGGVPR